MRPMANGDEFQIVEVDVRGREIVLAGAQRCLRSREVLHETNHDESKLPSLGRRNHASLRIARLAGDRRLQSGSRVRRRRGEHGATPLSRRIDLGLEQSIRGVRGKSLLRRKRRQQPRAQRGGATDLERLLDSRREPGLHRMGPVQSGVQRRRRLLHDCFFVSDDPSDRVLLG